jgi:hypothetical protein
MRKFQLINAAQMERFSTFGSGVALLIARTDQELIGEAKLFGSELVNIKEQAPLR